jgi:1-acyl-sn-glycerol-3-phosphate acyltransferase
MLSPLDLREIRLKSRPVGQLLWAQVLRVNYMLPRRTEVVIEGLENLPEDRRVFLAMNHTDRFNCWPFQLQLCLLRNQYACSWVKGKYYENPLSRFFLLNTSNIPLPSRGYVISAKFQEEMGRMPGTAEYRFLRNMLDGRSEADPSLLTDTTPQAREFLSPNPAHKISEMEKLFEELTEEVVRLNGEALDMGHHILVFPEGTRSIELGTGRTGLAQMSQRLGIDIVPIGCNGSDLCYSGNLPWSKGGRIVYRVGKPLACDGEELGPFRVNESYTPFTRAAAEAHGQQFQKITEVIMDQLNGLLDPRHQRSGREEPTEGTDRFL